MVDHRGVRLLVKLCTAWFSKDDLFRDGNHIALVNNSLTAPLDVTGELHFSHDVALANYNTMDGFPNYRKMNLASNVPALHMATLEP